MVVGDGDQEKGEELKKIKLDGLKFLGEER